MDLIERRSLGCATGAISSTIPKDEAVRLPRKGPGGKVAEDNFVMGRLVAPNLTRGNGGILAQRPDYPTRISSAY